jgi:hypothetical protein
LPAATAAAARFIRMSLHSSAVSWMGPIGDMNAWPPAVIMVFGFVSKIPFAVVFSNIVHYWSIIFKGQFGSVEIPIF